VNVDHKSNNVKFFVSFFYLLCYVSIFLFRIVFSFEDSTKEPGVFFHKVVINKQIYAKLSIQITFIRNIYIFLDQKSKLLGFYYKLREPPPTSFNFSRKSGTEARIGLVRSYVLIL
jgi:hypothetical protein